MKDVSRISPTIILLAGILIEASTTCSILNLFIIPPGITYLTNRYRKNYELFLSLLSGLNRRPFPYHGNALPLS